MVDYMYTGTYSGTEDPAVIPHSLIQVTRLSLAYKYMAPALTDLSL